MLTNVDGVVKLENHHFIIIIIKIGLGKNYQWMLNIKGKFIKEQDVVFPHTVS